MLNLDDIEILRRESILQSRSGAQITVYELFDEMEFAEFVEGHQGHRCYIIENIPKADETKNVGIGGKEYHATSKEILYVYKGGIEWHLEDLNGNRRTLTLNQKDLVFYVPPLVLHQYKCTVDGTTLIVHRNSKNIDTYYEDDFRKL